MKKQLLSKKIILKIIVVCIFHFSGFNLFAQVNTDEVIYANGQLNYSSRNWRYASIYLFAYIQRNPESMKTEAFRKEVVKAFDFSMAQLERQANEVTRLKNQVEEYQKKENKKLGSSEHGLEIEPPPLRKPSSVPKAASNYVRPKN